MAAGQEAETQAPGSADEGMFFAQPDPRHLSVSPVQKKRNAKVLKIVLAAARVLARDGHARFSIRSVADEAGLRASSLQHYFETKDLLLIETIRIVIGGYTDRYRALSARRDLAPARILEVILEDVFIEADKADIRAFHLEMWALARHDAAVAGMLNAMYAEFRQILLSVLRAMNPRLSDAEAEAAVLVVSSLTEGVAIVNEYHREPRGSARSLPDVLRFVQTMIEAPGAPG